MLRIGDYLDVVYGAHDQGMVFVAIMWAVFLGLFFGFGVGRRLLPSRRASPSLTSKGGSSEGTAMAPQQAAYRLASSVKATVRRYLLPDTVLRSVFGRVTRLQVLILCMLRYGLKSETHSNHAPGVANINTTQHLPHHLHLRRLPVRNMGDSGQEQPRRIQHAQQSRPILRPYWRARLCPASTFDSSRNSRIAPVTIDRHSLPELSAPAPMDRLHHLHPIRRAHDWLDCCRG